MTPRHWAGLIRALLAALMCLGVFAGCGGGGGGSGFGGGGDEVPKNQNITLEKGRANTQTFPNGSFPKSMALAGGELWVSNEYTKLIIASTDLDTLADRDNDKYPDICEIQKGFDADNNAVPNISPSNPIDTCGDLTFSRVSYLNASTMQVLGHVEVPREANYITANSDSVYVTHYRDGWLTKIDRATHKVLTVKKVGSAGVVGEVIYDEPRDRLLLLDTTIATEQPRQSSFFVEVTGVSNVGLNGDFTVNKLEFPPASGLTRRLPSLAFNAAENKVYVSAFDQKRIYQIDTSVSPPVFATYDSAVRGNRNEIIDTADPAVLTIDAKVTPILSASTFSFKDQNIPVNLQYDGNDATGVKFRFAYFPFTIDTNGDTTADTTYHAVANLTKGEIVIYEFVTVSGGKVTTDDKNKIRDPVRYKAERMIAKDYSLTSTVVSVYNKDSDGPGGLRMVSHEGKNYLAVLYPDVDKLGLITLPDNGQIHTATRFGQLTATGDYPQDVIGFDRFPLSTMIRLYVTGRNDNSLTLLNVDFTQPSSSGLAISLVQKEIPGVRPWDMVPAATSSEFYMALHGENSVVFMQGVR